MCASATAGTTSAARIPAANAVRHSLLLPLRVLILRSRSVTERSEAPQIPRNFDNLPHHALTPLFPVNRLIARCTHRLNSPTPQRQPKCPPHPQGVRGSCAP